MRGEDQLAGSMDDERPDLRRKPDGSLWLKPSGDSPLSSAVSEVEVVRERQRWMAAPEFSKHRYLAKPAQKQIGLLRAAWILVRQSMRPRDEVGERLRDIEQLILGGHNEAAERHIERFRHDYSSDETSRRVYGLMSLNLYDLGREQEAQLMHEFALLAGSAHPAMIEIFGVDLPDHWQD